MQYLKHLSISRISTGLTAFAITGFLISAILTDNGGSPNSQAMWRAAETAAKQPLLRPDERISEQARLDEWIDPVATGSIRKETPPAKRSGLSVLDLIRENNDVKRGAGNGPGKVSITVKPGDTLFGISRHYGLSIGELATLNNLQEPFTIKVGQTLYIAR